MIEAVLKEEIKQIVFESTRRIREKLLTITSDLDQWVICTVTINYTGVGKSDRPADHATIKVSLHTDAQSKAFGVTVD